MLEQSVASLALVLEEAWETRRPIAPLSESFNLRTTEEAYAVQAAWTSLRVSRGERVLGRKIGLTSRAMQEQMGVHEPDYGTLWGSRYFPAGGRRTSFPSDIFLQPRCEGEIAFLIGRRLEGPGVTPQDVLAAAEAVAPAVEVVDSRIADWRIKLVDTIADNASFGAFTLGSWSRRWLYRDLRLVGMIIHHNGREVVHGQGAAALGHPARAVAWLANKLAEFGIFLDEGDIVLSGALGRAVPVQRGDVIVVEFDGQAPLTVRFE